MGEPKASADPWHYPRTALARRYLESMAIGLISARVVYAKRRMGKSEFLQHDLLPAAEAEGYVAAYVDLSLARTHPSQALLKVLDGALKPNGCLNVVEPHKQVRTSASALAQRELSIEEALAGERVPAGPFLSKVLRRFDRSGRTMLLMLDEAQVLASPIHTDLAHALRACLDLRKQNIKVVFSGSSSTLLANMFGRLTEPFYQWAPTDAFKELGTEFVLDQVTKVNRQSRYALNIEAALAAFAALRNSPGLFRLYLNRFLANPGSGAQAALNATQSDVLGDANHVENYKARLPVDREALKLLALGVTDPHSPTARMWVGTSLGLNKAVSKSSMQLSLRRLLDLNLVEKLHVGDYRLQDNDFADCLRTVDLDA